MLKESTNLQDDSYKKELIKNWRAWGSWYSWGSPVGLGIYLLSLAGAVWIFAQLKPKNKE
ncbi:MAG: hypothetical protein ACOH18_01480 [Candidatus Saccharimonadaceae bacterium]